MGRALVGRRRFHLVGEGCGDGGVGGGEVIFWNVWLEEHPFRPVYSIVLWAVDEVDALKAARDHQAASKAAGEIESAKRKAGL